MDFNKLSASAIFIQFLFMKPDMPMAKSIQTYKQGRLLVLKLTVIVQDMFKISLPLLVFIFIKILIQMSHST